MANDVYNMESCADVKLACNKYLLSLCDKLSSLFFIQRGKYMYRALQEVHNYVSFISVIYNVVAF